MNLNCLVIVVALHIRTLSQTIITTVCTSAEE